MGKIYVLNRKNNLLELHKEGTEETDSFKMNFPLSKTIFVL